MLSLLERNITAIEERLLLLTPANWPLPDTFEKGVVDRRRHGQLLRQMQRMRGDVYVREGAVRQADLAPGRLHRTPQDDRSWHLLLLDHERRITACIWYLEHDAPVLVDDLRVKNCPLTADAEWSLRLRHAVNAEIDRADREHLAYGEVGGWAVSPRSQCPADGFLLAMACYSLSRLLGNALGVTTATVRHSSARILRRLGLERLAVDGASLPAYFDPKYGCEMELLRFDSREVNPRYEPAIDLLTERLPHVAAVSATDEVERSFGFPYPAYVEPAMGAA